MLLKEKGPTDAELAKKVIERAKRDEEHYELTGSYKKKKISTGGKNHILSALLACKTHNEKKFKRREAKKKRPTNRKRKYTPLHNREEAQTNLSLRRTKRIKLTTQRNRRFGSCYMDTEPNPPISKTVPKKKTK